MKRTNFIKGLALFAIVAGVASISQKAESRARVGFSVGVGSPYYGYGYGNCSWVDAAGIVHYRPCGAGYAAPAIGFGVGYWGGRRYYGGRRHWRGGHRRHSGGHHGGHRRRR